MKFDNRLALITFCFVIILSSCKNDYIAEIALRAPDDGEDLETYISSQNFSGTVYISVGENVLLDKGFGFSNVEKTIPNDSDTQYRIGSLTKQFTSAAILMLREKGLVSLDDAVSKFLPNFTHGNDITILQLLTHTSGLKNYTELHEYRNSLNKNVEPRGIINLFENLPLEFKPGSQFKYSNSGYIVLGVIIEKVTGISYQEYLDTYILKPLQMYDSKYATNEIVNTKQAYGLTSSGTGSAFIDMSWPYSAGALASTTYDLVKWDKALYEYSLLDKVSTDIMYTPFLDNYALGWNVTTLASTGEKVYGHGGGIAGYSSAIMRFPDSRKLIIILSNIDGYPTVELATYLNTLL